MNSITDDKSEDIAGKGKECIEFFDSKKAIDPVFMDLRDVNSYLSFFIVATGNSQIHCRALAKEFEKFTSSMGLRSTGKPDFNSDWIILDFGELIVHIFTEETRHYYQLERLWADAKTIRIKDRGDNDEQF